MGGKSGSKAMEREAERSRAEEEARQQRVRQGTADINAVFDGGVIGGHTTPGTETQGFFGAPQTPGSTTPARTVKGFDDNFYRGIRDGFTNYAMPQLHEQRDNAAKELTFSLDRAGQLGGSVRAQKAGELQKMFDLNEQQVRDQALAHENQSRTAVENSRADLVAMLNATGDNQQAVNSALSRSTVLTQPQAYSPLGQLFTDFTAGLSGQAARERAEAASGGLYKAPYNTGIFGGQGRVDVRR